MNRSVASVEIVNGKLLGLREAESCSFKGVPYAAATGGPNRFLAPQPVANWAGVRDALCYGDRCPQVIESISRLPAFSWYGQAGAFSENCCTLNIFAPPEVTGVPRPVIFYVHGGGYASGSCNGPALDGSTLASFGDVVVVTVNHRLNVFGYTNFTHLPAGGFGDAANAGQLDLVAALEWVNRNISAFGGDPENVTLLGQSGGGNKVMVLLTMPAAQGLFRRAINMSGASGLRVVKPEATEHYVSAMLEALGIGKADLRKLQEIPVEALQKARDTAMVSARGDGAQPVIDGHHVMASPFAPEGLAQHRSVPLIIGTTDTEATLFLGGDMGNFQIDETQLKARIQAQFGLDLAGANAVVDAYRTDEPKRSAVDILCHLASDILARVPLLGAAASKADSGGAPIYVYNFAWKMPGEHAVWRSPHAADIPFAFGTLDCARGMTGGGTGPSQVSRSLMSAFVAFARTGDPNNAYLPQWKPYDTVNRATMVLDQRSQLVNDFHGVARRASEALQTNVRPTALLRGPLFRPAA